MCFINRFLEDLDIATARRPLATEGRVNQPKTKVWLPPSGEAAKFNCDGGLSTLGDKGEAGVVCRDKLGNFWVLQQWSSMV